MNKKTYIAPKVETINLEMITMIATSFVGYSDKAADDSEVYSRGRRGKWGNLWYND